MSADERAPDQSVAEHEFLAIGVEYRYTNLEALGFVNAAANSADAGTRAPISDFRVGIAYKLL